MAPFIFSAQYSHILKPFAGARVTRKLNYGEGFDRLMDRATAIFNTLLPRATKTPRNYIIDQTNVYKNARKRKLKPFAYFQKVTTKP